MGVPYVLDFEKCNQFPPFSYKAIITSSLIKYLTRIRQIMSISFLTIMSEIYDAWLLLEEILGFELLGFQG